MSLEGRRKREEGRRKRQWRGTITNYQFPATNGHARQQSRTSTVMHVNCQLKIIGADTGQCPYQLKTHALSDN
ncbi:MAG: hypothetical protein HC849_25825 [Oscillatoriales cyanobacterium RU_3_3]|nr:hypothetical protein [Microcoleus sp. SU_5_6]NJL66816.1 hypothetical protein [Microcoleus sp. SM1_3_4]NJM62838.1 hypothetical protein [Oscillatoriales cyanobacterium RU_3_3]NJR26453.1 hypothetical protein [Richelia sp. CSU_2_1]